MSEDTLLKLKMLWLYKFSFRQWWREIWTQDGGERMCCDGRECGCFGADYASMWKWLWSTRKERTL